MHSSASARPFRRALLVALLSVVTLTLPASAQTLLNSGNPWHRIASFDTDEDHAHHILEPSPFDAMSPLQLAAVPKANRIHYNAPEKCVPAAEDRAETGCDKYGPITVNSTFRSPKRNRRPAARSAPGI
jgi:uncharacterized protein YcbK (DUF882 family)